MKILIVNMVIALKYSRKLKLRNGTLTCSYLEKYLNWNIMKESILLQLEVLPVVNR